MWRSKKLIVLAVLTIVVLAGSIGGVALADTEDEDNGLPEARHVALLQEVCDNYEEITGVSINCTALGEAFAQARAEMCPEAWPNRGEMDPEAMQEHLKDLVEQGKITQEQADSMIERCESMVERGEVFGFRGHSGFRGMGGMRGFGGPHAFPRNR